MNFSWKTAISLLAALVLSAAVLGGCGDRSGSAPTDESLAPIAESEADTSEDAPEDGGGSEPDTPETLTVRFGSGGEPFTMYLYDNDTAAAIAGYVGTANWQLPIYHYDDFENWEVMQYYDIPSRYEIPAAPETVMEEAAGTVYYSAPNRILLFYQDAQVSGEYTPVGYFDATEEFINAVEENPVLEGWGNKIVLISAE